MGYHKELAVLDNAHLGRVKIRKSLLLSLSVLALGRVGGSCG